MDYSEILVKTSHGLEEVLAEEIRNIGGEDIKILKRAVSFKGNKSLLYKSNIYLRTALRILVPLMEFSFRDQKHYYNKMKKIAWEDYLSLEDTFSIDSTVHSEIFTHSGYVAQLTKDAIVDMFREKYGKRPSVDLADPDQKINIYINNNKCVVSLDSSGAPLFKRGYRLNKHEAPLNEVLAAGMIMLSGWKGEDLLIDPMCGSGTIPIEAAMIGHGIPPGFKREKFGFMKWKDFDEEIFESVKSYSIDDSVKLNIYGSDIEPEYARLSKVNSRNANLEGKIRFRTKEFENLEPMGEKGIIIMNPPYGLRLQKEEINEFYSEIGSNLKHKWAGFEVWILTSNLEAIKHIGLRPSKKITLYNGPLECRFLNYSLYTGSKKLSKQKK